MELNEEQIEVVFKKAHDRANEKLPIKDRKPYQKTPLQVQQFKNMQKVRTQNIEHVNIASKIISESKSSSEQIDKPVEEVEEKFQDQKPKESVEVTTPEPAVVQTPGAPVKKTKKKKEEISSEEDDSETEDFLLYQKFKKKKQQAQLKLQAAKKQKKEQKQNTDSDDEEQNVSTPQHNSSSSEPPRAPPRRAFYFA